MASIHSNLSCLQLAIPSVMVASLKEELASNATLYTPAMLHILSAHHGFANLRGYPGMG